jgi:hypothetical protein
MNNNEAKALSCFDEYRHFLFDQRTKALVPEQRLDLKQRRFIEEKPLVKSIDTGDSSRLPHYQQANT